MLFNIFLIIKTTFPIDLQSFSSTIAFAFLIFILLYFIALNNIRRINAEQIKFKNRVKIILHDLRSPISSYLGLADMISYLIKNKQYDKIDLISKEIDEYAGELEKLYIDLNKYVNIEHDKETILEFFPLAPLLDKGLLIYSRIAKLAEISIINEVNFQTMVYTNDYLFLTMFRNVLDNAVKNSKRGSSIIVSAVDNGTNVCIAVTNFSANLKQAKIKEINDFFKTTTTTSLPNSRIGMHIIKNYSKLLQIELNMSNDSEKITFKLYVPKEPHNITKKTEDDDIVDKALKKIGHLGNLVGHKPSNLSPY
ncbi:sensor histidine kinase [Lacihabitans lacunae]|uniref:histidine kinase n=1 Tax=Lacihabitans lacunae TaxID=1028214 RepID=A0ABV7Z1T1_9BACT